jgi:hypothetical protein
MFKIKTLTSILFFFFGIYSAFTQTNFVAGAIITLNSDTIKGEIDYPEWIYNPRKIVFRSKNMPNAKTYTYRDIKGFTISDKNEKYQTAIVDMDDAPVDGHKLNSYGSIKDLETAPQWVRDTVFLLVDVQGRVNLFSLFQYADGKPHYFTQKNNGKIEELIYRRGKIINRDTFSVFTLSTYKNQLQALTSDCTVLNQGIDKLPYNKSEIFKVITEYNTCIGQSIYTYKQKKGQKRFLAYTGAALPLVKFKDFYNPKRKTAAGDMFPTLGVAFEQSHNRLRSKLAMGAELNFTHYKAGFSTTYAPYNRLVQYKVNTNSLKISPYIRYAFSAGKIQPFVKVGFGIAYINNNEVERVYTEPTITPIMTNSLSMSKVYLQYLTSIGLKYNGYFVEARLNNSLALIGGRSDVATVSQSSLICGYFWNFK